MPASIRVVTSSRMCGLVSANRPMPWPRTRVYSLVVYWPMPYLRNTSFSALAMSAAVTPSRTVAMPASIASRHSAWAPFCSDVGSPTTRVRQICA